MHGAAIIILIWTELLLSLPFHLDFVGCCCVKIPFIWWLVYLRIEVQQLKLYKAVKSCLLPWTGELGWWQCMRRGWNKWEAEGSGQVDLQPPSQLPTLWANSLSSSGNTPTRVSPKDETESLEAVDRPHWGKLGCRVKVWGRCRELRMLAGDHHRSQAEQSAVEVAQQHPLVRGRNTQLNPERRLKRVTVKGRLTTGFYFNS